MSTNAVFTQALRTIPGHLPWIPAKVHICRRDSTYYRTPYSRVAFSVSSSTTNNLSTAVEFVFLAIRGRE